jgi:hypothetical protein
MANAMLRNPGTVAVSLFVLWFALLGSAFGDEDMPQQRAPRHRSPPVVVKHDTKFKPVPGTQLEIRATTYDGSTNGTLTVADGIDTSALGAKMAFTLKSLMSDMYLDDLRDKTLRGLEGRALAGFATGNVAYGYHTVPVLDAHGAVMLMAA